MFRATKAEGTLGDEAKVFFRDEVTEATEGHFTELEFFN